MSRAERERQMLDVAEQVFGERGYQGTSMDEIAERCGVSKPMLYEYFGSKDGLLVACVGRSKAELLDVTQKAMAGATDPEDILWRGMVAYFGFIDAHSKSFAMLLRERDLRLLDNRRLVSQLTSLERRTSSGGRDRVDHPREGHDDLCNAAAGAIVAVTANSDDFDLDMWMKAHA